MRQSVFLVWCGLAAACGGDRASPDRQTAVSGSAAPGATTPGQTTASPPDTLRAEAARGDSRPVVLFLGNSLSAGLGVPEDSAFPALVQRAIDSAGLGFRVVNAGVSGATSADGLQNAGWLVRQRVDVLVLELGGNDALRGLPPDAMHRNLQGIVRTFRARYPGLPVVIAGMEAPTNMGPQYTSAFRAVFPALAREENATLIPFLLEGVGGVARLNQADRIHPNPEGHRRVAATVWRALEPVLRRARARLPAAAA